MAQQQQYNEEIKIHKDMTLEEYLSLSPQERGSDEIFFIEDVSSQAELLTRLLDKIKKASDELRQLIQEYKGLSN